MVKFINKLTGGERWVEDNRKDEYMAAGHKLAASSLGAPRPPVKRKTKPKKE